MGRVLGVAADSVTHTCKRHARELTAGREFSVQSEQRDFKCILIELQA
jgi:hypothetical protein